MLKTGQKWQPIALPKLSRLPREIYVRTVDLEPMQFFAPHTHQWGQFLHAISGVATANTEAGNLVIPQGCALWLPTGVTHSVYAVHGSQLRSLYIDDGVNGLPTHCCVLSVPPLLRELIIEVVDYPEDFAWDSEPGRLFQVIIDQIRILQETPLYLPLPRDSRLRTLCELLEQQPDNNDTLEQLGLKFGASSRTLARLFKTDMGLTFRQWKQRLRLIKSFELLVGENSVTKIALELGYQSTSAFAAMFRRELGCSPSNYLKNPK